MCLLNPAWPTLDPVLVGSSSSDMLEIASLQQHLTLLLFSPPPVVSHLLRGCHFFFPDSRSLCTSSFVPLSSLQCDCRGRSKPGRGGEERERG